MVGWSSEIFLDPETPLDGDVVERISSQEIRRIIDSSPADLRAAVTLCDIEGFTVCRDR